MASDGFFTPDPVQRSSWIRTHGHHLAAAVLLAWIYSLLADLAANPAHRCAPDEPTWITSSYLTFRLVTQRAPAAKWADAYEDASLGPFGNLNPPVGKLMIGALVALHRDPADPVDYVWEWPLSYEANRALGNIPPDSLLIPVRQGMAGIAVATLLLVYVCALQVTGARWLALLAPGVLALSPIFRLHATQAYTDVPQLFWIAAAVVAFNDYLLAQRRRSGVAAAAAMGLACAVKFSAAPIVLVTAAFVGLRDGSPAQRLRRAVLAGVIPFAVFVAVNPYLYSEPVPRLRSVLAQWSEIKQGQKGDPVLASAAIHTPVEGLVEMSRQTLTHAGLDHPLLWKLRSQRGRLGLVAGLALGLALLRYRFELPAWHTRVRPLALLVLSLLPGLWVLGRVGASAPTIAAGALWLFAPAARDSQDDLPTKSGPWLSAPGYLAACALGMLLVSGFWLPFRWGRYALPTLLLLPPFYVAGAQLLSSIVRGRTMRSAVSVVGQASQSV